MQSFGVYVPEQDAAWETQDNGTLYDDLLERHNRCDAKECECPEGRETDEDYTIWEIVSTDHCFIGNTVSMGEYKYCIWHIYSMILSVVSDFMLVLWGSGNSCQMWRLALVQRYG